MSVRLFLQWLYKAVRDKLTAWNLFNSRSTDVFVIRRELLSTRLYVILVIISLIILTTYTSIIARIEKKTVTLPNLSVYENLQEKYSDSLTCSCSEISIPYGNFVKTAASFHQVCSSDFISQLWIDFVFQADLKLILPIDVRTSLSAMWQLIQGFCVSATNSTLDALNQFENSSFINSMLLTKQSLEAEVQATLDSLYQTTSSNFVQSMTIVHRMVQANQLVTALLTNYIAVSPRIGPSLNLSSYGTTRVSDNFYIIKNSTGICSCKTNGSCSIPGNIYFNKTFQKFDIYDMNKLEANETLSGIIIDCLPLQMTLSSSLECFYNQSCINILLLSYNKQFNISILNQSMSSRFNLTTKIELLINELFIEEIFNEINYTEYYVQCLPDICNYIYIHRFNWIYVLPILFSLLGGITTVLHVITPYIIKLGLALREKLFSKKLPQNRENDTIRVRLKKVLVRIAIKVIRFNLYTKYSRDPIRVYHGILATRLYVILLFLSLFIIIVFSQLSTQTINEKITNPSKDQYQKLEEKSRLTFSNSTLTCPCTQLFIPYEDFVEIELKYHQICSSDFVQSWWYQKFLFLNITTALIDFPSFSSSYFQTMATFCNITDLTLKYSIQRFLTTNFVNSQLLSKNLFDLQINSSLNTFIQLTQIEFLYRMSLTRVLLDSNQYFSNVKTSTLLNSLYGTVYNVIIYIKMIVDPLYAVDIDGDICYCVLDSTCTLDYKLLELHNSFTNYINWQLEGIRGGCSLIDFVLKSSMICWFQKDCLNQLQRLINRTVAPVSLSVTPLDSMLSSRYSPNSSTEIIFNELMIEEWNFSSSFEKFYEKCKPSFCSLTYEEKTNIIYIITTIISLIGGIHVIIRLICPLIIQIIFKTIHRLTRNRTPSISTIEQENHETVTMYNRILNLKNMLINKLLMLNLFDSESNDIETIHRERISTRLYLLVFSITMYIITMYTLLSTRMTNNLITNPSENQFYRLLTSYKSSLECPCNKIAIEYEYFIDIDPIFHDLCSSDFISMTWRQYLFDNGQWYDNNRRDIRMRGGGYFTFLSRLCTISQTTIQNAIDQFLNDTFISLKMISTSEFHIQIDNRILQFQQLTLTKFARSLQLLRDIMNGNALVSSYNLNWYWWRELNDTFDTIPISPIEMNNGCSCGTRSDCIEPGGIYLELSNTQQFLMPGWNVGCSVVETLLRSSMECFYNQTCINMFLFYATTVLPRYRNLIQVSAVNSSNGSRFQTNTTIQNIADELFVEKWNVQKSYSSFYNQCAPTYCSYETKKDDYVIYTISKLVGLYGGLTITLRFVIPLVVNTIFKIRNCCRANTVTPVE